MAVDLRGVPSLNAFTVLPGEAGVGPGNVTPIPLDSGYGWLHPSWSDVGVVICPGVEHDVFDSYRPLRLLAVDLAHSGYTVLRLNYEGTGDAAELDGEEPCAAWLDSVAAAVDRLQAIGIRRVVLCGFRLGGLLAGIVAAKRNDICATVLLDPILQGKSYLRELEIARSIASDGEGFLVDTLEIDGIELENGPEAPLRGLSLRGQPATPGRHILLLSSSTKPGVAKLADHWRGHGAEVEQASFASMSDYDNNNHMRLNPDFRKINNWLAKLLPVLSQKLHLENLRNDIGVATEEFSERPIYFGPSGNLFGMLCSPRREVVPGFVLLIGNIGAIPHQGSARFHVLLARRLAAAGFASFRFDFAGLGESDAKDHDADTHIYETDRIVDFSAAVDILHAFGYRRFAATGLCSGAYHAWRAALSDSRLEVLIMLNPTTFSWIKGQTLKQFLQDHDRSIRFYVDRNIKSFASQMTRASGWLRLARGELGVVETTHKVARIVSTRTLRWLATPVRHAARLLGWPTRDQLPFQAMQRLSARGVRTLVVMSATDSGLKMLHRCFGRNGRRLSALPHCSVQFMANVDHSFSRRAMQEKVADAISSFLRGSFPASSQPVGATQQSPMLWASVPEEALCRTHASP